MTAETFAAHVRFLRMVADGRLPIQNKALLADIRRELAEIEKHGQQVTIDERGENQHMEER